MIAPQKKRTIREGEWLAFAALPISQIKPQDRKVRRFFLHNATPRFLLLCAGPLVLFTLSTAAFVSVLNGEFCHPLVKAYLSACIYLVFLLIFLTSFFMLGTGPVLAKDTILIVIGIYCGVLLAVNIFGSAILFESNSDMAAAVVETTYKLPECRESVLFHMSYAYCIILWLLIGTVLFTAAGLLLAKLQRILCPKMDREALISQDRHKEKMKRAAERKRKKQRQNRTASENIRDDEVDKYITHDANDIDTARYRKRIAARSRKFLEKRSDEQALMSGI